MYKIKLKQFQGPLDLLLQLIEKKSLDLTEISLAKVTDQYLIYLKSLKTISLDNLADFLIIASRLVLAKSRLLLPFLELDEEEEEDIELLKKQLEEYKKFRNLAERLKKIADEKNISYNREKYWGIEPIFYLSRKINLKDFEKSFKAILNEIALLKEKLPKENLKLKISIKEKIEEIQKRLLVKTQISFQGMIKKSDSKIDIIVRFLALLELTKQKLVKVEQKKEFEEIIINKIINLNKCK